MASPLMLAGTGWPPSLLLGIALVLGVAVCVGAFRLFITPRAHLFDYAPVPRWGRRSAHAATASVDDMQADVAVWPVVVWWACVLVGVVCGAWLVTSMVRGETGSWWQAFERLGIAGAFWGGVVGAGFGLAVAVLMWTVRPGRERARRKPGT